jgi:4-hydroxybenzoate polyprenyltransferase
LTATTAPRTPRATRAGRLLDYLNEMFPPLVAVPATLLSFASVWFALHALAGVRPIHLGWRAAVGALTVVLFSLLLRVYDELKDVETDLRLGKAGDPRYKDRAVVTGRVQVADIVALRNGVLVALVLLNLTHGLSLPLFVFAGVLTLLWLSSRWFFCPPISRHLLLAFITHNPLAMTMSVYVVAVFLHERGLHAPPPGTAYVVVGFWMITAAWEIARKVRHPAQETAYQTYSKVLGWRLAAFLPVLFGGGGVACLVVVARLAGLGWILPAVLVAGWLPLAMGVARFEVAPSERGARLQPLVETLGLVASLGMPIALGVHQGLGF